LNFRRREIKINFYFSPACKEVRRWRAGKPGNGLSNRFNLLMAAGAAGPAPLRLAGLTRGGEG
jgi:hypothetical protein